VVPRATAEQRASAGAVSVVSVARASPPEVLAASSVHCSSEESWEGATAEGTRTARRRGGPTSAELAAPARHTPAWPGGVVASPGDARTARAVPDGEGVVADRGAVP